MNRCFLALIFAALLPGCARVPQLGEKPAPREAASLASDKSILPTNANWPAVEWWTGFGDPALNTLITEALANSPDVAAAAARVRAADALAEQAGAALKPSANLEASAGFNQQSRAFGIPANFLPGGLQDNGRIAASASFNPDLWGRNRAALAAATSESAAARVDAEQARLMLTTGIAAAYADLASLFARRDVATAALNVRTETARITDRRYKAGIEAKGPVQQAQARVPATAAEISALDEAITLTRHRLAALAGAGPDRGLRIARPELASAKPGIPGNAAIDLVGRRPDLVSARLHAEAQAARIDAARAAFYPNISLSALIGGQSLGLGNLFDSTARTANVSAAISLPLFDGGRLSGQYRQTRAEYDGAIARYDGTLLTALREVADAATSRTAADAQLAQQREALALSEAAAKAARARWLGGLSNQLPVLVAEDAMIANQRAVAETQSRRMALEIALIRALGGGYRRDGDDE